MAKERERAGEMKLGYYHCTALPAAQFLVEAGDGQSQREKWAFSTRPSNFNFRSKSVILPVHVSMLASFD